MAWFWIWSWRCTANVQVSTSKISPLVQICIVVSGNNVLSGDKVGQIRDELAKRLRDELGIPSGGTHAPDGGQLYVMSGGDLRVIGIEHPDPEGGDERLRSIVLRAIKRLGLAVEHLPEGDADDLVNDLIDPNRAKNSPRTDTPHMYTWCFDHGQLHAVPVGTDPWCTGFWVFLTGMSETEAIADKQSHYGEARHLRDLPPETRDRLIQEYGR